MPLTTSGVSGPAGLDSDSFPVEIELLGVKTHLADSMQFMLEMGCRLHRGGVYYLMPSFRGEQTDCYHLPQFHHAEVEITGLLPDVIALAEAMLPSLPHCAEDLP